jgi:pimeloyl-ACP methyl ester carboxylesterase
LGLKSPLVVGWSLGGHIALEMAGRGHDISALLITGAPPITTGLADFQDAFLPAPAAEVTVARRPSAAALSAYVKALYGDMADVPALYHDLARRTDGRSRETMGQNWAQGYDGCCERTVAAGWFRPIAVIHGLRDPFISRSYFETCAFRNLWRDRIIDFERSGHAPFAEEPDRFNECLLTFAKDVLG